MVGNLDLLIDLVAIEDAADLAEVEAVVRWLHAKGLIDLSRVRCCERCKTPFAVGVHAKHQRYCSSGCRQKAQRLGESEAVRQRRLATRRAWYAANKARRNVHQRTWRTKQAERRAA